VSSKYRISALIEVWYIPPYFGFSGSVVVVVVVVVPVVVVVVVVPVTVVVCPVVVVSVFAQEVSTIAVTTSRLSSNHPIFFFIGSPFLYYLSVNSENISHILPPVSIIF
jgi:uncharacterized membrane protein